MALLPPDSLGFGDPSPAALETLNQLEQALDDDVPRRSPDNLLIATWNIKALARVTKRWTPAEDDDPKRNLQDICCLATVISHFDVVAVVEIKRNLEALRLVMSVLGPQWGFIVSDVTEGTAGNEERLGFVFRLDRVKPSGMAGELVIPDEVIALGDFNIDRHEDPNWRAFVIENGLSPPDKLLDAPRTVGDSEHEHSYFDQIAWFNDGQSAALTLDYEDAGSFIWDKHILEGVPDRRKESRLSDHYPLWAEFGRSV